MKESSDHYWQASIRPRNKAFPLEGRIELTYRCNLNCVHCFTKGLEDNKKELSYAQWKEIIDSIYYCGGLYLIFSGGEPLVRDDFFKLYQHAKKRGFLITVFTNGIYLKQGALDFFSRYPPHRIELTLNGITERTYESVTQTPGAFARAMEAVRGCVQRNLPLVIKANCLKENRHEITKIKSFVDSLFGRYNGQYHFRYDPMVLPGLNGDRTPCQHRLPPDELVEVIKGDWDMWQECQIRWRNHPESKNRISSFLYRCDTWKRSFSIDPYGRLKFCPLSNKFSVDLKKVSFRTGFFEVFPGMTREKFKTNSKCRVCPRKILCYTCPSRAYLETGDEEAPVPYYCQLVEQETQKCKT